MANDQRSMPQLHHRASTDLTLNKERKLQPRPTGTTDVTAVSRVSLRVTQPQVTGPVPERWLRQNPLPRLSRRPYETQLYFQQRMTAGASTQDMTTVSAITAQSYPGRSLGHASKLSNGRKTASLERKANVGEHLMSLAPGSLKEPPLQDFLAASETTNVPRTLFEALSPGSTIEDTGEEHKAAVELCLGSFHLSSAKRRHGFFPGECLHERSSKRIRSIEIPSRCLEELGAVEATVIECENLGKLKYVNPHKSAPKKLESSALHAESNHFSSLALVPNTTPTEVCFNKNGHHMKPPFPPEFRPFQPTPQPFSCAMQTLANPSTPFSDASYKNGEEEPQPVEPDQDLGRTFEPRCAGIELSQVVKCKGVFLGTGQIWCPVPGNWEDAVELRSRQPSR